MNEYSWLKPGMVVNGKVTRVVGFGAFVDIGNGITGLVHVSDLGADPRRRPRPEPHQLVRPGQLVRVMVLDVSAERKRLALRKLEDK